MKQHLAVLLVTIAGLVSTGQTSQTQLGLISSLVNELELNAEAERRFGRRKQRRWNRGRGRRMNVSRNQSSDSSTEEDDDDLDEEEEVKYIKRRQPHKGKCKGLKCWKGRGRLSDSSDKEFLPEKNNPLPKTEQRPGLKEVDEG